MAQNVTFNINLKVNGKDAVQKVTMNVDELRHVVDEAKTMPVARRNNWLTMFCFLYIFLKYCQ